VRTNDIRQELEDACELIRLQEQRIRVLKERIKELEQEIEAMEYDAGESR
jgi:hypothetical protein